MMNKSDRACLRAVGMAPSPAPKGEGPLRPIKGVTVDDDSNWTLTAAEERLGEGMTLFETVNVYEVPAWLKIGARVRKAGRWPRYELPDGAVGEVVELNQFAGELRWFRVLWEGLENYPRGVEHPGWHCIRGNVVPDVAPTL